MKKIVICLHTLFLFVAAKAQLQWVNVDSLYAPLPATVHVYKCTDSLDGAPNIAYYVEANLRHSRLIFDTDTTINRRITPTAFYQKNAKPLVVMNGTFFSFESNKNLNPIVKNGKLVAQNLSSSSFKALGSYGDSIIMYNHPARGVLGINKHNKADIGWAFTDTTYPFPFVLQYALKPLKDTKKHTRIDYVKNTDYCVINGVTVPMDKRWKKMQTAIGGGPVLVQNNTEAITNNEELLFAGKAIKDKHPRTAIGYTNDRKLILLVVEGRNKGVADGASLIQLAKLMVDLGCKEALNLDGGGSSCMLVNGKPTIKVSDKTGERPIPGVFIIKNE